LENKAVEFGEVLRSWRSQRKLSQLELSHLSNTSARHISFLEKGRSQPSREMVHKLARTLNISSSDVNSALVAAGFAPLFPKVELDSSSVSVLKSAVDTMLKNHMPWPAVACDAQWDLLASNTAAKHLLQLLNIEGNNLMQAMLAADDIDGPIANWPEVARMMLYRLNTEQLEDPTNKTLQAVRKQLSSHARINENLPNSESELSVVVPIKVRTNDSELSFFSMIAQFGAVQEITYSGIHVELFFPADPETEEYLKNTD